MADMTFIPQEFPNSLFKKQIDRAADMGDEPPTARVWVGTRELAVRLDAEGLWVPLTDSALQGCWAADVDAAADALTRRGVTPLRVHLWRVLTVWYEHVDATRLRPSVKDSPLGGALLLPDPDDRREGRRDIVEYRWRPMRPEIKRRKGGKPTYTAETTAARSAGQVLLRLAPEVAARLKAAGADHPGGVSGLVAEWLEGRTR